MAVEESKENQGAGETARTATDTAGPAGKQRGGKRTRAGIILLAVIAIGLFMGTHWFLRSKTLITTDNAFVEAHIHAISPRVSGTVTAVPVMDNQFVKKGETLVELDPTDYEVRVRSRPPTLTWRAMKPRGTTPRWKRPGQRFPTPGRGWTRRSWTSGAEVSSLPRR